MGAVTERIRFVISVLKLTVRHPVLVAKQAASTAVLTNDRLTLGVGTSPWPEDYQVCDVPFERRGQRADESIEVMRGLLTGDWFEYHGEIYDIPRIKQCPVPSTPIPIIVGGHAEPALRRAARNDGWIHGGGDLEALPGSSPASTSCAATRVAPTTRSRSTSSRWTRTRATASSASRSSGSPT